MSRAPKDMDVRSWKARILTWSGSLDEAEREYKEILSIDFHDPDNWAGLATVYSRRGRADEALRALDRAIELDPNRADLHIARGWALQAADQQRQASREFRTALALEPQNAEARRSLRVVENESRHELRVGSGTDLFSFADANHDEEVSLA